MKTASATRYSFVALGSISLLSAMTIAPALAADPDLSSASIELTSTSPVAVAEDAISRFLEAHIAQSGDGNVAAIMQTGDHNYSSIQQAGNGGIASIMQSGSGNRATISQH